MSFQPDWPIEQWFLTGRSWRALKILVHIWPQVVQKVDNAIHGINHYPLDSAIGFPNTYPLDSDSSGGYRYPTFEQLGPGDPEQGFRR